MTIKRIGEATPSGTHELYNNYLYSGEENLLMLSRTFTTEFICNFQLEHYPFDTQVCTMVFVMKVQGDHSACGKPPVDFKTKVPLWPG